MLFSKAPNFMRAAQWQALLASAGFGWKKPKGENAKRPESLQVWAYRPESLTEHPHLSSARRERRPYGRQSPEGTLLGALTGNE